jgi:hypothetical protein
VIAGCGGKSTSNNEADAARGAPDGSSPIADARPGAADAVLADAVFRADAAPRTADADQGVIPDPGSIDMIDSNAGSTEPNDTPSQATPLGTAGGTAITLWVSDNTFTTTDEADYFVFNTGATTTSFSLGFGGICADAGITNLSVSLWRVVGGHEVDPPDAMWSGPPCLSGTTAVSPNTEYLLGIIGTGTGNYFA